MYCIYLLTYMGFCCLTLHFKYILYLRYKHLILAMMWLPNHWKKIAFSLKGVGGNGSHVNNNKIAHIYVFSKHNSKWIKCVKVDTKFSNNSSSRHKHYLSPKDYKSTGSDLKNRNMGLDTSTEQGKTQIERGVRLGLNEHLCWVYHRQWANI